MNVRQLTKHERKRYFDSMGRFEAPEFLGYGDESGEYYDAFVEAERAAGYLPSPQDKELEAHLQVTILDYHYENVRWLLNEGRDYYDEIILPPIEEVQERYVRYMKRGVDALQAYQMALDWVYKWREKNAHTIHQQLRALRLRDELARAERMSQEYVAVKRIREESK